MVGYGIGMPGSEGLRRQAARSLAGGTEGPRRQEQRQQRQQQWQEDLMSGLPLRPGQLRRVMMNMQGQMAGQGFQALQGNLADLDHETRILDDPEAQARYLAPRREALDRAMDSARADAARALAGRGLTDSSYGAAVLGGIEAGGAQAGARLNTDWMDRLDERQLSAKDIQRQVALAMATGNTQALQAALDRWGQLRIQQEQLDQSSGFNLLGILGDIGGAVGAY